ncbi:MAG TPA: phosphate ABC transporter substrate-binding protein PstS [Anaerolineae bacterium]|nr:phosphate ABC transporter substrate-binding protein PstS [Anaerolineae bacterium]
MRRFVFVSLLLIVLLMAACTGKSPQSTPSETVPITGAGATFPYPLYSKWFHVYSTEVDPTVHFNYQSIGSGGGIRQVTAKTVDFGASDAILGEKEKSAAPGLQMFPTVAGGVVVGYNLTDAGGKPVDKGLRLTPDVVADIFLGKITRWNDERLQKVNPDIALPDAPIAVAHRSDGSGTTFLFTSYLALVSSGWQEKVGAGKSVNWPVGIGGKGNEGVAGVIRQQPNSIGYIELAYARQNNIAYAFIQNRGGNFIEPSLDSITAASDAYAAEMPEDMGQLLVNAPGEDSYPIAGYTFILLYQDVPDCVKAAKIHDFMVWALTDGDGYARELLYAPLGAAVEGKVIGKLNTLTCEGGKTLSK